MSRPNERASVRDGVRRDPWRRFAAVFGTLAVGCELAYYGLVLQSAPFDAYLVFLARTSSAMLLGLGQDVAVTGSVISSSTVSVEIGEGCDAIQLCGLLVAAVIAFPVSIARRLRGVALALTWMQSANFVRIVSLYWIGLHFAGGFEFAHRYAWPATLIALAVTGWIAWAVWERRATRA